MSAQLKYRLKIKKEGNRTYSITVPMELINRLALKPVPKDTAYGIDQKDINVDLIAEQNSDGQFTGRIIIQPVNPNYESPDDLINNDEEYETFKTIVQLIDKEYKNPKYKHVSPADITRLAMSNLHKNKKYMVAGKKLFRLSNIEQGSKTKPSKQKK